MGKGLLQYLEQPCDRCREGGQEGGCLHHPRPLPHQDQGQASHKSWCEDDVRPGDQGEGKASKDGCESFPSCSTEAADLSKCSKAVLSTFSEASSLWEPHGVGLKGAVLAFCPHYVNHCTCIIWGLL